ncbi:MAG: hypothetical protein QOJ46_705, partial [bacterium]
TQPTKTTKPQSTNTQTTKTTK